MYESLQLYGHNLVASEGEAWKKYRKICAPSFSESNNKLVWDETVETMNDLFNNVWGSDDQIICEHALKITMPVSTSCIFLVVSLQQSIKKH